MADWFTVEKIDNDTFVISEYKHWEETHCYLLRGDKQAVLIDTGLGVDNIKNVVDRLTTLPILVLTTMSIGIILAGISILIILPFLKMKNHGCPEISLFL
jgi:glyoxylase-like metal-dependent hydrolase (beta-lactamase superfamily II)